MLHLNGNTIILWLAAIALLVTMLLVFSALCKRRKRKRIQSIPKNSELIAIRDQFNKGDMTHDQYEQRKFELLRDYLCLPAFAVKALNKEGSS